MPIAKFGRYEVVAEIGQGAMGKVYRGFDPLTQRAVAIKAIREEVLEQDETGEYLKRFQREARAAGGLSHPNIVTVFDVGERYFVMEYLEGPNLLARLAERGRLTLEETLDIVSPVADALAYAHSKGVYHRDIKPANIVLVKGSRPVITDFGLAHLESTVMTNAGEFLGSPSYMSPEQIIGGDAAPSSDLFSLSVVIYEMLTGKKPFPGDNITTVVYKVVHGAPVPPHEWNPDLPREYEAVFERALAKDPRERFASFADLVTALNLQELDRLLPPRSTEATRVTRSAIVVDRNDREQGTAEIPIPPATESNASITERKRHSRGKRLPWTPLAVAGGTLAAVALALVLVFPRPEPTIDVELRSEPPGAEVFVDGVRLGSSPLGVGSLSVGEHRVRLVKEGFLPLEEAVVLREDEVPAPFDFALQPATVALFLESVPAGARVRVDGEDVGATPLVGVELEPGQHEVEVANRGYETWRSAVAAQGGESVNLVARLRSLAPPKEARRPERRPAPGQLVELGPDDTPPKRIEGKPPSYPPMARKLGQQGRVTVSFVLTEDGVPTDLRIVESAGKILDEAVLESMASWRYEPAVKNGVKVRVRMTVRQSFRIGS